MSPQSKIRNHQLPTRNWWLVSLSTLAFLSLAGYWMTSGAVAVQQSTSSYQQSAQERYEERRQELEQRYRDSTTARGSSPNRTSNRNPPQPTFQSGSERSELVLREISATLKSIDKRLETIEQTFVNLRGTPNTPTNADRFRRK